MASEVSGHVEAGSSETTIEIKVKTMDSQTYTLQVDKQIGVPALKECIASVTGVVTDRQRLICRGKVLRDDQLLSAYHVEDGHTLHMVVREPVASSSEASPGDSASDHSTSGNHGRTYQIAPGVFVETLTLPGQGDTGLSDATQVVSDILRSLGITNTGGSNATTELAGNSRHEAAPTLGNAADTTQIPPAQSGVGNSNRSFMLQMPFDIPVIQNAVNTLSQYLRRMRQEFLNSGNVEENNDGASSIQGNEGVSSNPAESENAIPTPASLAELLSTTRQMLNQIAEECMPQLARHLGNQESLTDPADRANAQADASRSGILFHNLGAFFLELGRTVMTVRLGRSPSEAIVNAGPAVFVSPTGPNPLMVQPPLPFQRRRMDIQIHRVSPSTNQTEPAGSQHSSGQRISSPVIIGTTRSVQTATGLSTSPPLNNGDGTRNALPATNRSPPEVGSVGFMYTLLGRNPNLVSDSQVPGNMQTPVSTAFQSNVSDSVGTGRAATSSSGQRESASSRSIDIDIGVPTDQNAEGQIPRRLFQFLSGLFPGIQVESVTSEGIEATEVTAQAPPSGSITEEQESRVTMEGLFFSAMLRQLMPLITQNPELERAVNPGEGASSMQSDEPTSSAPVEDPENRTSRHREDDNPALPNSKRQKME